jgi:hypothetical protein
VDEIKLNSVNWEHGMLLSPDHFLRQEQYIDSLVLWALRYTAFGYGLIGGGPRLPESERGSVRHDPIVVIDEDEETVGISVSQARGLTASGRIIEIQPDSPVSRRFSKDELAGVSESNVYVVCDPVQKDVAEGEPDEFNPQMRTERRRSCRIVLQLQPNEAANGISVARIRRPQYGAGYEKDSAYIPLCTSMVSFSELTAAWRRITEEVTVMAGRYTELYKAMREFLVLIQERGIETEIDREVMGFVERTVVALQNTIYEILDPVQPPARFFACLRRFFYSVATYMDLTPGVQQYYDTLKEIGETEFIAPVEQQKRVLQVSRSLQLNENLAVDVRSVMQSLHALSQLEKALEGKYINFRVSTALEGMNFIFDRGGQVLYKMAAKPSRVQGSGDELTIYFSNLRLEGREKYRLILVGEPNATFEKGDRINAEVRLNEGSGFRRSPIQLVAECQLEEQRNFECDFDAPEVPTIQDARVTLLAHHPVRTALLFVRHRFYGQRMLDAPPMRGTAEPRGQEAAAGAGEYGSRDNQRGDRSYGDPRDDKAGQAGAGREDRFPVRPAQPSSPPQAYPPSPAEPRQAPWDLPRRGERLRDAGPEEPPPPRRRRLE